MHAQLLAQLHHEGPVVCLLLLTVKPVRQHMSSPSGLEHDLQSAPRIAKQKQQPHSQNSNVLDTIMTWVIGYTKLPMRGFGCWHVPCLAEHDH
jgi:hypothetical protein